MKLKHALILLLFSISSVISVELYAQQSFFKWAKKIGGIGLNEGKSIVTDASNNIYITGHFMGTADFDPDSGITNLVSKSKSRDIFVQKLDSNGGLLWAKKMGNAYEDQGRSIAVDDDGNVYTAGFFRGVVDFDPGVGVTNLASVNNSGDAFVQKLDSNGNFVWVKQIGGKHREQINSISIDTFGDLLITGLFGDTVSFDIGGSIVDLVSNGGVDILIQKMDTAGNFLWAKQVGGPEDEEGYSVATDRSGNVYITGSFMDTVDFDPGVAVNSITTTVIGGQDIFVQKLDTAGNFIWVKQMGGNSTIAVGTAITTDEMDNLYLTGLFAVTVDFDPGIAVKNLTAVGARDVFVQKLDSSGNFIWVKQIGGRENLEVNSIQVDKYGNVYTTGLFQNEVDFDPGKGSFNLNSIDFSRDIFIQKLDQFGNFQAAFGMGSLEDDRGNSIAIDSRGDIYTTGFFNVTVDFDPSAGVFNLISDFDDIFVQKLDPCFPIHLTDVITACDSYTWINGITYFTTNDTAKTTVITRGGCDSTVYLDLTILQSTDTTTLITSCEKYTWAMNNFTYDTTGIYADTLVNNIGCDSIIYLDLTILKPSDTSIIISACDDYTWPTNNFTYYASGLYSDTLTNQAGCDSIITLDLTINTVDSSITQDSFNITANLAGASYQWLDCNDSFAEIPEETNQSYTVTKSGSYAVEITKNECIDTSTCVVITVGLLENSFGESIYISPNPTSEDFDIKLSITYNELYIRLLTLSGQVVESKTVRNTDNITMKLKQSKGVYFVEVSNDIGEKAVMKIIKK